MTKPLVIITIEGGNIQVINSDVAVKIITLDFDTDGIDEELLTKVNGSDCCVAEFDAEIDKKRIDQICQEIKGVV